MNAEPLNVGANAPRVSSTDQNGESVDLGALYDSGYVLVYFYPKADTSGCTKQACSLRDAYEAISDRGVTVVGVSADTVDEQGAFTNKYHLPFTLLADTDGAVIQGFGVPQRPNGRPSRQAYLVKDGVVVWRDLQASTEEQAADLLSALDQLEGASS